MPTIIPTIFHAYDIRGVVDGELSEDLYVRIGAAFSRLSDAKQIVVGMDARSSSPAFLDAVVEGIRRAGTDVVVVGRVPVEVFYYFVGQNKEAAGLFVGASHNPPQYNGAKMVLPGVIPLTGSDFFTRTKGKLPYPRSFRNRKGKLTRRDPWPGYLSAINQLVGRVTIPRLKIVVDAGNGLGGLFIKQSQVLNKHLDIIPLYLAPDGSFPHHLANPLVPANRAAAKLALQDTHADLAVLFDGDADRVIFLDDQGHYVPADFTAALIVEELLTRNDDTETRGKKTVVIDPRRGWAVSDTVSRLGGKVVVAKSGYPSIKAAMREQEAIYGFEASGHNFFREMYYSESSMVVLLLLLSILGKKKEKLSRLLNPFFLNYFMIEEENFPLSKETDIEAIYQSLQTSFSDGEISTLDGLSISYPDWHLNLRTSNTEPLLRLNLEARSRAQLERIYKQIEQNIRSH